MTVAEIKNLIMFQTNNDADDLGDFLPYLMDYINEGYDLLLYARDRTHISDNPVLKLVNDTDVPDLPLWTHKAIADWATWLVYRNGNPQKQQRGYAFRSAFMDVSAQLTEQGADGSGSKVKKIINIPW